MIEDSPLSLSFTHSHGHTNSLLSRFCDFSIFLSPPMAIFCLHLHPYASVLGFIISLLHDGERFCFLQH
ncbi:hypothetical protein EUTSA_v10026735mg [Eutrema salsugineum]|uniref:Uncharacterized protein n=1 Tax=Eutrema salsugineum TaxID=72664 RepID=V4P2C9_EUTSA|nr:hypothetical protein EUTSA_v10026735mg [Eutrema salsugineum]